MVASPSTRLSAKSFSTVVMRGAANDGSCTLSTVDHDTDTVSVSPSQLNMYAMTLTPGMSSAFSTVK
jgi:hypothetical protein